MARVALAEPPLLAVEIVRATSRERDLVTKRREYADARAAVVLDRLA